LFSLYHDVRSAYPFPCDFFSSVAQVVLVTQIYGVSVFPPPYMCEWAKSNFFSPPRLLFPSFSSSKPPSCLFCVRPFTPVSFQGLTFFLPCPCWFHPLHGLSPDIPPLLAPFLRPDCYPHTFVFFPLLGPCPPVRIFPFSLFRRLTFSLA